MKVQFDRGGVRIRVGRAELAALQAGERLATGVAWTTAAWRLELCLADAPSLDDSTGTVRIALPRSDVDALAARLPSRDGLRVALPSPAGPVEVRFEVDLHDGRARTR